MNTNRNGGFTLVELMIVVAIIAILSSIAYPIYTSFILKGKRAEGRTALAELLQQQERYMTQRNVYLSFTNTAGTTNPVSVPFKTHSGDNPASAAYYLQASVCSNTVSISDCVMVEAIPARSGSDPEAATLQMLSTGAKTCTGTKPSICWK